MSNAHAFDSDSTTAREGSGSAHAASHAANSEDLRSHSSLHGLLGPDRTTIPFGAESTDEGTAPVDITPKPVDRPRWPGPGNGRPARRSRRRMIILGTTLVVALAGAAGLGTAGWRIAAENDTALGTPSQVAGLHRDDSERARTTADYLRDGFAADIELDRSIGAVYADPADAKRSVLLFGGTTLLWRPERELNGLFELMSDDTGAVAGLHKVPAGKLGGIMKCGNTSSPDGDIAVCGWADHGSVAMAMFPARTIDESAALLRQIRETVQTRS